MRVLDLQSPNMISSTIYEHIRRVRLCIVDLTEWRANVFFEFGVRCTIEGNPNGTFVIIDKAHVEAIKEIANRPNDAEEIAQRFKLVETEHRDQKEIVNRLRIIAEQCVRFLDLFDHMEYVCNLASTQPYRDIIQSHMNDVSSSTQGRILPYETHRIVSEFYIPNGELYSKPVYSALHDDAEMMKLQNVPTVIFPKNKVLAEMASEATTEKYYAAWAYLDRRFGIERLRSDKRKARSYVEIGYKLVARLTDKSERETILDQLIKLADTIEAMVTEYLGLLSREPTFEVVTSLIQLVDILRYQGRVKRDNSEFDAAAQSLDTALEILLELENLRDELMVDANMVRSLIAECYGQKGSVYNRSENYVEAARQYEKGLAYEGEDSTYNLSNTIVNSILADPNSLPNQSENLANLISKQRQEVEGKRSNDIWGLWDFGQFLLLAGELEKASEAYSDAAKLSPENWMIESHRRILLLLQQAIEKTEPEISDMVKIISEQYLRTSD